MTDFVKVPDSMRKKVGAGRPFDPGVAALMEGATIFVPFNGREKHELQNKYRMALKRKGFKAHYGTHEHEGTAGIVVWAEKDGQSA